MKVYKEYIEKSFDNTEDLFEYLNSDEEPQELIRCKDCKHRPTIDGEYEDGFDINFPDMRCPCQCEDGWYNLMPKDDWYCANAERKEE